jgi:hypothetical protein
VSIGSGDAISDVVTRGISGSAHRAAGTSVLYNTSVPVSMARTVFVYVHVQKCAGSVFKAQVEGAGRKPAVFRRAGARVPFFKWFPPANAFSYKVSASWSPPPHRADCSRR